MSNREFLQLAVNYDPRKHGVAGWYMSEKLDGMRAFWDGGISRGVPVDEVPWANVGTSAGAGGRGVATGLWSRYGKVIHAPDYWLDELPPMPLDGELYCRDLTFQNIMSIVKRTVNIEAEKWACIEYRVFDSPDYDAVFSIGKINNVNFKKVMTLDTVRWAIGRSTSCGAGDGGGVSFKTLHKILGAALVGSRVAVLHEQEQLPFNTGAARRIVDESVAAVVSDGGEGLILRNPVMPWFPKRCTNVLKVKPVLEGHGVVVGYVDGKGKHLGRMGSVVVTFAEGKGQFCLSGFTDAERENPPAIGSTVRFSYRTLTDSGLPKEARYVHD